ncbi:hypothetical protein JVT61DRAFT_4069 [Boletus reticuloceps]|uniref:Uncharacterized protein n=1 Tax=Boletus reticuloceps TaxID=495285 RepID=A0A8I2YMR6_9AGAM|nr:hypothetical protein JVT61DRAFT_4069 [Boletus reticuloceps]
MVLTGDTLLTTSPKPRHCTPALGVHMIGWRRTEVACPDTHCKSSLRIIPTWLRSFRHSEVTTIPLPPRTTRKRNTS